VWALAKWAVSLKKTALLLAHKELYFLDEFVVDQVEFFSILVLSTANRCRYKNRFHVYSEPLIPLPVAASQLVTAESELGKTYQKKPYAMNLILTSLVGTTLGLTNPVKITTMLQEDALLLAKSQEVRKSLSTCRIVAGVPLGANLQAWGLAVINKEIAFAILGRSITEGDGEYLAEAIRRTIRIVRPFKHGTFTTDSGDWFTPRAGYQGRDSGVVSYEYEGKRFEITLNVIISIPKGLKPLPIDCRQAWKLPKPNQI
jgi:hypothetical protein